VGATHSTSLRACPELVERGRLLCGRPGRHPGAPGPLRFGDLFDCYSFLGALLRLRSGQRLWPKNSLILLNFAYMCPSASDGHIHYVLFNF
jgi:hypothetical protein